MRPRHEDDDCFDEREDEDRPRKKNYVSCKDRTCGALDCPSCFPSSYKQPTTKDDE